MNKTLQLQPKLKELEEEGVEMITVTPDDRETIEDFWDEEDIPGKVFFDDGAISESYGVSGLPMGVLVDGEGYVVDRSLGWQDSNAEKWEQKVRDLLE